VIGAALTVLLLVLAPSGAAGGPTSLTPPFHGTKTLLYRTVLSGGCGAGRLLVGPAWRATTGFAHAAGTAKASACAFPGGASSDGESMGEWVVSLPVHISTNGSYTITLNWTLNGSGSDRWSAGKCPYPKAPAKGSVASYCFIEAEYEVVGDALLYDLSNGTIDYASGALDEIGINYTVNDTTCSNGSCSSTNYTVAYCYPSTSCSFTGSTTSSYTISAALVASHHYALVFYGENLAYASIDGYPSGSAHASFDLGLKGHSWALHSIVVS
jgi:hypothetical protein